MFCSPDALLYSKYQSAPRLLAMFVEHTLPGVFQVHKSAIRYDLIQFCPSMPFFRLISVCVLIVLGVKLFLRYLNKLYDQ